MKQHTTVPGGYGNTPLDLKVSEAVYNPSLISMSNTGSDENVPNDFPLNT
jgi:hypothetical protein